MDTTQLAAHALDLASQEFRAGVISAYQVEQRAQLYYAFLVNPGRTQRAA